VSKVASSLRTKYEKAAACELSDIARKEAMKVQQIIKDKKDLVVKEIDINKLSQATKRTKKS